VGQVATTHLEQVFRNDTQFTLEGTYFFPIPETASIVEFAIWENGKKLVGEVRSREEARRIYDEIVRRQKDPGLLEYAGKDLFQASIFPIPPKFRQDPRDDVFADLKSGIEELLLIDIRLAPATIFGDKANGKDEVTDTAAEIWDDLGNDRDRRKTSAQEHLFTVAQYRYQTKERHEQRTYHSKQ
jgi:hypothetical protein